ncbi:DUF6507 family protein [Streptomyces vinaceus]
MSGWDIKPQGVQSTLKTVGGNAGELQTALNALITAMSEAAQAAGTAVPGSAAQTRLQGPVAPGHAPPTQKALGPVAAALGQYLSGRKTEFDSMADRIEACILGAVKATNEYLEGDLDSAKHAQDAARAVNLEALREQPRGGK